MNKRGFTLVEILIAISLFTLVAVISSNILVGVFQLERRTEIENGIYEDVRLMMQLLSDEIQNGAIDYEEYYSINVVQSGDPEQFYGLNYGIYASRFYDPGRRWDGEDAENPDDLGLECSLREGESCKIYWTNSADLNRGRSAGNAFCEGGRGICDGSAVDELYLLDKTGKKKTILVKRLIAGEDHALGLMRMEGVDYDQNGTVDLFHCAEDFNCDVLDVEDRGYLFEAEVKVAKQSDKGEEFDFANLSQSQFIPITPLRSTVKELKFIINPLDNPYNAFAEKDMQAQPTVTIILTVGLAEALKADYPGDFPDITVQTTVMAGVKERFNSYPPIEDKLRMINGNDKSWISDVLEGVL